MSGQLHYRKGGIISGNKLLDSKKQPFAELNHDKRGFFLYVAYKSEPDLALLAINPLETIEKFREIEEPELLEINSENSKKNYFKNSSNYYTDTELWHKKLGHPSYDILAKTARITTGIPVNKLTKKDLNCKACISGKFTRKQPKINYNRADTPLYRICLDTLYITPASYSGYKYIIGFTDDKTSLREVEFTKEKSDVFDVIKNKLEYYKT
jgi:hypothetical protein